MGPSEAASTAAEATTLAHRVAAAHPTVVTRDVAEETISDLTAETAADPTIEAQKPACVDGFRHAMGLAALAFGVRALVPMAVPG